MARHEVPTRKISTQMPGSVYIILKNEETINFYLYYFYYLSFQPFFPTAGKTEFEWHLENNLDRQDYL